MDLVKNYGPVVGIKWGPGITAVGIACPRLFEDVMRHQETKPERGAVPAWKAYLESNNIPKALLTS